MRNNTEGPVVVGVSAHFHDSAVAVLVGGELVGAAHEERFTRVKQDPDIPREALRHTLREAGLTLADVDCVAYYEDRSRSSTASCGWACRRCPTAAPTRSSGWTRPAVPRHP